MEDKLEKEFLNNFEFIFTTRTSVKENKGKYVKEEEMRKERGKILILVEETEEGYKFFTTKDIA